MSSLPRLDRSRPSSYISAKDQPFPGVGGQMSAAPQPLILVVEDDAAVCTVLCTFLEDIQHRVAIANDHSTGAEILKKLNPALLIIDIILQGENGNNLARLARTKDIPVLLMSGDLKSIERLQEENAPFLQKPFRLSELEVWVNKLLPSHNNKTTTAF